MRALYRWSTAVVTTAALFCSQNVMAQGPAAADQLTPPETLLADSGNSLALPPPAPSADLGAKPVDFAPVYFDEPKAYDSEDIEAIVSRLAELEGRFQDMDAAEEKKIADALKKSTFKIGGRIHFDTAFFPGSSQGIHEFENPGAAPGTADDPEARLFFRRIRFEAKGTAPQDMLWRIQIDFNNPAVAEYKDVYIGKKIFENTTVLVGNQKRPLGLDHLNSSRFNVFMERPLVVEAFNPDARRIGIAGYTVSDDEVFNYRYGAYVLENTRSDGRLIGDSLQGSLNARAAMVPIYNSGGENYLHMAVAGMIARPDGDVGPQDTNNNEARFSTRPEIRPDRSWVDTGRIPGAEWYQIAAAEFIYNRGPLQITGEAMSNWMQRDSTTPGTGQDLHFHGAYVYVHYMLTGEHVPLDRKSSTLARLQPHTNFFLEGDHDNLDSGWGAWGVGARISYLDITDEDIFGGVERNVTLGVNWWWSAYAKWQFNAVFGDIEQKNPAAFNGFSDGTFMGITTRFAMDF